jgi:hypothetical protein
MHIGAAEVVTWTAIMVIVGFLWRSAAAKLSDSPIGKAMAFIY